MARLSPVLRFATSNDRPAAWKFWLYSTRSACIPDVSVTEADVAAEPR